MMLLNLAIFGGAMVLLWAGYRVLHHPRGTAPPVPTPSDLTSGDAPGPLASGAYRLTLGPARWVKQSSLPTGIHLTFRARPIVLVDYVVVHVTVANGGSRRLPFSFEGAGQDVRLLLASTDPESAFTEPLTPHEAALVSGDAALASGPLAPGESRSGVVAYALEPFHKGLELLLVPDYPPGVTPESGRQTPAIEMRFTPGRG